MKRTCVHCGTEFVGSSRNRSLCSDECRVERKAAPQEAGPCSDCGESAFHYPGEDPLHPQCRPVDHGSVVAYRSRGCRCDVCRTSNAQRMREYAAKRKAEGRPIVRKQWSYRPKPLRSFVCEFCEQPFKVREKFQKFCSAACFGRYFSAMRMAARPTDLVRVGPVPSRWADAPPTPVTVVSSPKWWAVIIQGPCSWCGEPFAAPTGSGRASFCSKRCSSGFHKSKRRFNPSPRFRLSIYERDKWTCQLCFEPIDRDAHYLNDWAPSLDHIECQSWALLPDHSPENLRTCHRFCNAVRGDGTYHANFFEGVPA